MDENARSLNEGREGLNRALGRIAWASVFLYLDVNINMGSASINLLPEWAGYALIFGALKPLAEWVRSARLLRPLSDVLMWWTLALWLLAMLGLDTQSGWWYLPQIVASLISIYLWFQLLTNLAELAAGFGLARERSLRRLRNFSTVLQTLMYLPWDYVLPESEELLTAIGAAALIAGLAVIIWTFSALFGLRRDVRSLEE